MLDGPPLGGAGERPFTHSRRFTSTPSIPKSIPRLQSSITVRYFHSFEYDVCIIGSGASGGIAAIGGHGEMLANEKSCVDLDSGARDEFGLPKARMHLEWGENELAVVRDMHEKCVAVIEAAGGKVLGSRRSGDKPWFDGENLVGTVRMGNDPRRSVLNSRNQAHDVKNLWVLDGASFTSFCEKNPTLTVIAVAIRAADHLAEALRQNET